MDDRDNDISSLLLEQTQRMLEQALTPAERVAAEDGAWSETLWRTVVDAGLPLGLVTEKCGGIGLDWIDGMKLVRETARFALPLPLADTMIALRIWTDAGGDLTDRPLSIGAALPGELLSADSRGALQGRLHGMAWPGETLALCPTRASDGDWGLALLTRAHGTASPSLSGEPRGMIDAATVPAQNIIQLSTADDPRETMLQLGALARSNQIVGALQQAIDLAISYVQDRVQFGRPLAKFQAVQQMLAEAAGHVAAAAAAADQANEAVGGPDQHFHVAVAKARCGEAGGVVSALVHQAHGAIGFTKEYPLHQFTRRIWAWREEFGNETYWQEYLGRLACAHGGHKLWHLLLREIR